MTKKICALIQDLIPLYIEGEVSDTSCKSIEKHLKNCDACREMYQQGSQNAFEDVKKNEYETFPQVSKEKKFILRARRVVCSIMVLVLVTIISSTVFSYHAGKTIGVYGERFRMAEQQGLFIPVDEEKTFEEYEIVLEKVLVDNAITSLILKSNYDINDFDSVTLKDDEEQYYRKVNRIFHTIPKKYQQEEGYTILNYAPISDTASKLVLELINWEPYQKLTFEFAVEEGKRNQQEYEIQDIWAKEIDSIHVALEKVVAGVSQSEWYFTFDRKESAFEGVSFGWYFQKETEDKRHMILSDKETGEELPVLAIEDITYLQDVGKEDFTRPTNTAIRMVTNPIDKDSTLQLAFEEVYAYYYLGNKEISLDFTDMDAVQIDKKISVNDHKVHILWAEQDNGSVKMYYEVLNNQNQKIDALLDVRIRDEDDYYSVPMQGEVMKEADARYIYFETNHQEQYVISLARLGEAFSETCFEVTLN